MHSSNSKIQWNSKVQKNLELSEIIPNYSDLYLKAHYISNEVKNNIILYLNNEKDTRIKRITLK